tara:strand:- start:261 stop:461 length:201 start_codon:yes stop_codon:yes gene_type:complete
MEILKFQRPLASNGTLDEVLVYNQDKSLYFIKPMTQEEQDAFFGDNLKVYGYYSEDDFTQVEEQVW